MQINLFHRNKRANLLLMPFMLCNLLLAAPATVYAAACGSGTSAVTTAIDFGCKGKGNGIMDLTFALVRFLSIGVGLAIVGSMIWAGIQYTSSRGDPNATAQAINRIKSNVLALIIYIFAYAIVNFLVPGAILS